MGVEVYVPSYIWKEKIKYQHKEKLVKKIIEDYKKDKVNKSFVNDFNTNKTTSVMKLFENKKSPIFSNEDNFLITELFEEIKKKFELYLKFYNINKKFSLERIWYAFYDKTMKTFPHDHVADFSGVYYLKFNKEVHRPTFFYINNFYRQPNPDIFCDFLIEPDVEEEDIIFFPSGFPHGARSNISDECRILISFDFVCENFSDVSKLVKKEKQQTNFGRLIKYL